MQSFTVVLHPLSASYWAWNWRLSEMEDNSHKLLRAAIVPCANSGYQALFSDFFRAPGNEAMHKRDCLSLLWWEHWLFQVHLAILLPNLVHRRGRQISRSIWDSWMHGRDPLSLLWWRFNTEISTSHLPCYHLRWTSVFTCSTRRDIFSIMPSMHALWELAYPVTAQCKGCAIHIDRPIYWYECLYHDSDMALCIYWYWWLIVQHMVITHGHYFFFVSIQWIELRVVCRGWITWNQTMLRNGWSPYLGVKA